MIEETPGGFAVVSTSGVRIAYVYVRSHPAERGLNRIEALALAKAIAGLSG
jgi:hypothetical protein